MRSRRLIASRPKGQKEKLAIRKQALAQGFADWVVSSEGQASIAAYRIAGEQLFFPNAKP